MYRSMVPGVMALSSLQFIQLLYPDCPTKLGNYSVAYKVGSRDGCPLWHTALVLPQSAS